jgi:peptidoglycan/LPS O-acetylase OafA/YrhL
MILMSAFLLYLPYAREKLEGIHAPSVKRFYFNRAVRILPSYLFAVFGALLLPVRKLPALATTKYSSFLLCWRP